MIPIRGTSTTYGHSLLLQKHEENCLVLDPKINCPINRDEPRESDIETVV